jgi:hypothetical protein
MSWIVHKNKLISSKKDFILISNPKCGGSSLERMLKENKFNLTRPNDLNLIGHFTLLDTYYKLAESRYRKIKKYLIPIRESLDLRFSWYNYIKQNPEHSGHKITSDLFKKISFKEYIELLVTHDGIKVPSIEILPFLPRSAYLENKLSTTSEEVDLQIFIYDMTNGFKDLFKIFFEIDVSEEIVENTSLRDKSMEISKELKEKLMNFDDISHLNSQKYIYIN